MILTTTEIFEQICDDCGTGNHDEPNVKWIRIRDLLKLIRDAPDVDRVGEWIVTQLCEETKK
jgi:hypothetical protein